MPQLFVMSSSSVTLSSLLRLSLYFFFLNPLTVFPVLCSISLILKAYVSSIFLAWFPVLLIQTLPTPLQSLNLRPPPHHPYVSKPTDQTKSPHKFQPSSSNQPNCCRTWCLRERVFFAGKHYLMASDQPLRARHCLIVKKWASFFSSI